MVNIEAGGEQFVHCREIVHLSIPLSEVPLLALNVALQQVNMHVHVLFILRAKN